MSTFVGKIYVLIYLLLLLLLELCSYMQQIVYLSLYSQNKGPFTTAELEGMFKEVNPHNPQFHPRHSTLQAYWCQEMSGKQGKQWRELCSLEDRWPLSQAPKVLAPLNYQYDLIDQD